VVHSFDNNGAAVTVDSLFADQVRKAAEEIAEQQVSPVMASLGCPQGGTSCVDSLLDTFGTQLFRRPLTEKERTNYHGVHDLVESVDGSPEGIKWVLIALLQSPHFLYRAELGEHQGDGVYQLDGYEVASQLSYLVWGTLPDAELFAAAESGDLLNPEEVEAQLVRLLEDPKARGQMAHFSNQWLEVQQLATVPKDGELYPDFTPEVRADMGGEITRWVNHVLFDAGGSLGDLFTTSSTFVTPALAAYYGLPTGEDEDGDGYGLVSTEGSPYGGLLTQGALLTRHSFSNGSSPIHRGMVVRERLLCHELPPPPPGLVVEAPPVDPTLTTKERFIAHSSVEPCKGCHDLVDPIGYGFEAFDGAAVFREEDNGFPIDDNGEIVGPLSIGGEFKGIQELHEKLAGSAEVHDCYSLQWFRYGYGLKESQKTGCLEESIREDFAASSGNVQSLIQALGRSIHVMERVDELPLEPLYDPDDLEPIPEPEVEGGESGDEGGAPVDVPEQTLKVDLVVDSEWDTGYCASVIVVNEGEEDVAWLFSIPVEGEITQIWNALMSPNGSETLFQGVDWNMNLAPGASAEFGFCAAL